MVNLKNIKSINLQEGELNVDHNIENKEKYIEDKYLINKH